MDNALPFELTEEAFTGCVVAAMPDGTHAADQRVAIQKALVDRPASARRSRTKSCVLHLEVLVQQAAV